MKNRSEPSRVPLLKALAGMRFFTTSLMIHMGLIALLGGVILFKSVEKKEAFVGSVSPDFIAEENTDAPADEFAPPLEFEEKNVAEAVAEPAPLSAISSLTEAASFNMASTFERQNLSNSFGTGTAMTSPLSSGQGSGAGGPRRMSSLFGSRESAPDALTGYFYDLKQTPDGKPTDIERDNAKYLELCAKFATKWDPKLLEEYYKAKDSLSTYQLFIPLVSANSAPEAYGVQDKVKPTRWLVHYTGSVVAPVSGKFRFAGQGDNILVVRFNRKVVFDGSLAAITDGVKREEIGKTPDPHNRPMVAGEWFQVTAGTQYPIEVILGEHGGLFATYLMIQEQGKTYSLRADNKNPALPVFQTAPIALPDFKPDINVPAVASSPFVFSNSR